MQSPRVRCWGNNGSRISVLRLVFRRRRLAQARKRASWSSVAAGRLPAFLHFWQTSRPARSWTHVVGTWGRAHRSTSRGVWQREHLISSHGARLDRRFFGMGPSRALLGGDGLTSGLFRDRVSLHHFRKALAAMGSGASEAA
jgi:hypothetical protein